jgi:hypothetical protein
MLSSFSRQAHIFPLVILNGQKTPNINSEEDLKRIGKTTPVSSEGTSISSPVWILRQLSPG